MSIRIDMVGALTDRVLEAQFLRHDQGNSTGIATDPSVLAAFLFTVLGLLYDAAPMVAIGAAALAWAGLATLARRRMRNRRRP